MSYTDWKRETIAARDLQVGHVMSTRDTPLSARASWFYIGTVDKSQPGVVVIKDQDSKYVTTLNHGDPVTIAVNKRDRA